MDSNFARALKLVLKYEGGYVNHPSDPGGPTNKGVTLATFRRYVKKGGTVADLKAITDAQVATVYHEQYWDAVDGDGLPSGIDFAVFDFAVNSGVSRALKYPHKSIDELCDARLAFMRSIKGGKLWKTFGKGWAARVADVRKNAKAMAASLRPAPVATIPPIEPKPAPAPAPVADSSIIEGTQKRLTELKYNPGGIDGKIGPLTAGAIRVFRADNGLPEGDFIDAELLTALATAQPRKMVPERANATGGEIAAKVPEAKAHWWNKYIGGGIGGAGTLALVGDAVAPARSYVDQVKDLAADVPGWVWIAAVVLVAGFIAYNARTGQKAADEAYRAGDRR